MKICVFGAGAVGGTIAARLRQCDVPVSVVARGANLDALRRHGLVVQDASGQSAVSVDVCGSPGALGPQDIVVLAVKAPALAHAAMEIAPLVGPKTTVLVALNGFPWWFFHRFGGPLKGLRLQSVDPGGAIERALATDRVLGCVIRFASSVPAPGIVRHNGGTQVIVGELDGHQSERASAVVELLSRAGFEGILSTAIQTDVWYKLWGNMTMNPISAITGADSAQILADPLVESFSLQVMEEAARLGALIGCPISQSGQARNAETRQMAPFKTSMLQDVESGRPTEVDALLAAVVEIGQKLGVGMPATEALLGIARLHARVHGLYPA